MNQVRNQLAVALVLVTSVAVVWLLVGLFFSTGNSTQLAKSVEPPLGLTQRQPWTTSKFRGTPEPPPPYKAVSAFPKLSFKNAVVISSAPGSDRFFVGEHSGKIFSFPNDPNCEKADLVFDLAAEIKKLPPGSEVKGLEALYGLTFHPQFAENRYCYVCYVVTSGRGVQLPEGTRVSRFTVSKSNPPTIEPGSEQIVITWLQGGHNGGCVKFGLDGCLYISTGDGGFAFPPDARKSGQDVSNLLSSILRIDVDHLDKDNDKKYSIPKDNPFVSLAGARGEIWCYGLRNPWRMSFDRATGDLWVGDVGWELWELVYKVQKGGNYGWSVVEGRQPVHPDGKVGPTPILPPTIEIPHTDGVSITGGFVYRGNKFPELVGTYVFGDWETRRIWGAKWDDAAQTMSARRDLLDPVIQLVDVAEDHDGELYLMGYATGDIYRMEPNDSRSESQSFPTRLSHTGLFVSTTRHQLAPGVQPFSPIVEQWSDHATAERFIALPGDTTVTVLPKKQQIPGSMFESSLVYPKDTVLGKTLALEMERGNDRSSRRIETQLLHFDGLFWRGYSYRWNDEQTDATLVDSTGQDVTMQVQDERAAGGKREQAWHFASRMECVRCHNQWTEYSLAFNVAQLNKEVRFGQVTDNQIRSLENTRILKFAEADDVPKILAKDAANKPQLPGKRRPADQYATELPKFAAPHDPAADLNQRARSYLHVNCAHCHRNGGGGSAYIHLPYELAIEATKMLDEKPAQGTFDIEDAKILAAGDPYRSTLFYRLSKTGAGRMPHIGSEIVDEQGVKLISDWIRQLPLRTADLATINKLKTLDEPTAVAKDTEGTEKRIKQAAQKLANERRDKELAAARAADSAAVTEKPKGNAEVTAADLEAAREKEKTQMAEKAKERATGRADAFKLLFGNVSRALLLSEAIEKNELPAGVRDETVTAASSHTDARIRDLFERFLEAEKRPQRLGRSVKAADILALKGDAARGREMFFTGTNLQCKNCHRVEKVGATIGPDLTQIAKKNNASQLLESILEPSKMIDPKYISYVVETASGQSHTGLLVDKTETEVVLKTAKDQEIRIPLADVEQLIPSRQSLMPDLLLRDLSLTQVVDLLAFLETLK